MWLLPSRRRPASLARFFAAYRQTAGSTPGMVIVDRGDLEDNRAQYDALGELPLGWFIQIVGGETQGDKIAEVWDEVKDCAWLGLIGDDCVPQTPGWDRALVERLDGANLVSCNDGWQAPQRLGNCWAISGDLVRAVGWIFPPGLQHLYVDDVWELIGREAQCWTCRMDVLVEHRHVLKGAAPANGPYGDETHRTVYGENYPAEPAGGLWASDAPVFTAWAAADRHRAVAAAKALRSNDVHSNDVHSSVDRPGQLDPASQRRLDRARQRSVMILTPIARAPVWQYTMAFAETCVMLERLGFRYSCRFVVGSSNPPRARNVLAARFLAAGFDDAILIDDDMGWSANDVLRLLASEQPLIAAVGRKKVDKPNTDANVWCCHFWGDATERLVQDAMGAVNVPRVGTGMMKIARSVFEAMIAAHPEWKRDGDPEMEPAVKANYYRFFAYGEDEGGEDFRFCDAWRALGGAVWIDPSISLSHVGEKAWSGRIADQMQVGS